MHLIVGVDPGTTTGIAVLDFTGRLLELSSSKDLSKGKVIDSIIKHGRASIVASDVVPAPAFVSKLAAQLGAVVYTPQEPILVSEKTELTRPYSPGDSHQRDALAAALTAYMSVKNKFQKIDSLGLGDEVKHLVVRGFSIDEAEKSLREGEDIAPEQESEPRQEAVLSEEERRIRRLEKQNILLKKQLEEKKGLVRELERRIAALKGSHMAEMRRDAEIRKRESSIKGLQSSLRSLKKLAEQSDKLRSLWKKAASGEVKPVGVFPEVFEGFTFIRWKIREKDLPLFEGVRLAFTEIESNHRVLAEAGVFSTDVRFLHESGGCFFIRSEDVGKLKQKSVSLERILEDYRRQRA